MPRSPDTGQRSDVWLSAAACTLHRPFKPRCRMRCPPSCPVHWCPTGCAPSAQSAPHGSGAASSGDAPVLCALRWFCNVRVVLSHTVDQVDSAHLRSRQWHGACPLVCGLPHPVVGRELCAWGDGAVAAQTRTHARRPPRARAPACTSAHLLQFLSDDMHMQR